MVLALAPERELLSGSGDLPPSTGPDAREEACATGIGWDGGVRKWHGRGLAATAPRALPGASWSVLVEALQQVVGRAGTVMAPCFASGEQVVAPDVPTGVLGTGTVDSWPAEVQPTGPDPPVPGPPASSGRPGSLAAAVIHAPGSVCSAHPLYAFAAVGRCAAFLIAGAPFHHPLGSGSPLARLHQLDGKILLLGTGQEANPAIHLAEVWAGVPHAGARRTVALPDGSLAELDGAPGCSAGFTRLDPLLRQARIQREGAVGGLSARVMPARLLVSLAMAVMEAKADWLLCSNPRCAPCSLARKLCAPAVPLPGGAVCEDS